MRPALIVVALLASFAAAQGDPISRNDLYVKDADTVIIVKDGNKRHKPDDEYRLVGFDAPETTRGKCPAEIELGNRATARLLALLGQGTIELAEVECACPAGTIGTMACNHGRRCGRLSVDGLDVGTTLIAENH